MTDPATEYAAATERVRAKLLAAQTRKHIPRTGLDDDPRTAHHQAADFFTRPGDFHQLEINIPVEDWAGVNGTLSAQCVIKFTPDDKPLVIEILRQIRGALAAHITLTPAQFATAPGVTPIPMSNGQTAHAITPPPRPTSGRHAKPGDAE